MSDTPRTDADELAEALKAGGFCEKHKPNGGARTCLVCGCQKLHAALSRISYACETPNEMEVSSFDVHCNEDAVVKQVEEMRRKLSIAITALEHYEDATTLRNPTDDLPNPLRIEPQEFERADIGGPAREALKKITDAKPQ